MSRWRAMRFFMANGRLGEKSDGLFAPEQGDHKKHEKDEEADFGDAGGGTRDAAKTENSGNKGNDDEGKGPGEHDSGVLEFGGTCWMGGIRIRQELPFSMQVRCQLIFGSDRPLMFNDLWTCRFLGMSR